MRLQFLGNIESPQSVGTNNLIKKGAHLVSCYNDIIDFYPDFLNKVRRKDKEKVQIKSEYKDIYKLFKDDYLTVDKIAVLSGNSVRETINIVNLMELDGLLEFELGKGYRRKEQ